MIAEFIATLVEGVVGLLLAFLQALPAIIEALLYMLAAAITLLAYAVSPSFRAKKRKEWANRPLKKFLELGFSGFCLVSLVGLVVWLTWPASESANEVEARPMDEHKSGGLRVTIKGPASDGITNGLSIAVEKDGLRKIFETESISELRRALRENVTVVGSGEAETNGTSPAADSAH
jgi:hypothetical protein